MNSKRNNKERDNNIRKRARVSKVIDIEVLLSFEREGIYWLTLEVIWILASTIQIVYANVACSPNWSGNNFLLFGLPLLVVGAIILRGILLGSRSIVSRVGQLFVIGGSSSGSGGFVIEMFKE